jgi:outer membrane protein TolC
MGASFAAIKLSQDATVAAHRNLELVKDAYGRGVVDILDLLDAQNAAVLAEEGAANAAHDFLFDLMEVERSIGKFYFRATQAQRDAWFDRLDAYFERAMEEESELE